MGDAIAAVDCGTNSTRILITDRDGRPLERRMRITRLGQGVDERGRLDPDAVQRTIAVIEEFRGLMDAHGVGPARVVVTSAGRDAEDTAALLAAATTAAGVPAELLSGAEEGRLAFAGATGDLDPAGGPYLVVDVGGGSTELVAGGGPGAGGPGAGGPVVVSLDIGCVRVTERHLHGDPPDLADVAAAEQAVTAAVRAALAAEPAFGRASRMVGLAGTVSALAAMEQRLASYDRDRVHHFVLTARAVRAWLETLVSEDVAGRCEHPGLEAARADVIAGGALVLAVVMGELGFDECLVSESDLLDGMILSMI